MYNNTYKNSLIFDGKELGKYGVIERVERPVLPEIQTVTKQILGRDGVLYRNSVLEPLFIQIYIRVFNKQNLGLLINELAGYLYKPNETKPLNYNGNKTWYDATLYSLGDIEEKHRDCYALLKPTFLVPYPYGRSKKRVEIALPESQRYKITLETNIPTKPIFKINYQSFDITNMTTGQKLWISDTVPRNYVIDTEKETVTVNGVNYIKNLSWKSELFSIKNKDDIVASCKGMTMSYYERYYFDM